MPESDYPWIDLGPASSLGKAEYGWTRAECSLCDRSSGDNAEPYTEDWMDEHAQECHPRWSVRRGLCKPCDDSGRQSGDWIISDSRGAQFGCRTTHSEAMDYAQHKARQFLAGEVKWWNS